VSDQHPLDRQPSRGGTNWRLWALGVAALLFAIVVVQNSQEVPIDFLFVDTTMPLIFGLLGAGLLGFVVGWLAPLVRRGRHGRD
jgi:uncharacterized integral membrane protein